MIQNFDVRNEQRQQAERIRSAVRDLGAADLLRALVQAGDGPPADVRQAARVCQEFLDDLGIESTLVGEDELRPNVVSELPSTGAPSLWLNSHLDIVPAGSVLSWGTPPFSGVVNGSQVHGRGTVDAKGSVTAQLLAFA